MATPTGFAVERTRVITLFLKITAILCYIIIISKKRAKVQVWVITSKRLAVVHKNHMGHIGFKIHLSTILVYGRFFVIPIISKINASEEYRRCLALLLKKINEK